MLVTEFDSSNFVKQSVYNFLLLFQNNYATLNTQTGIK